LIARTWRGSTRRDDADRYLDYMKGTGVEEYLRTEGNRGALVLRREADEVVEFLFVSLRDSVDAIRRFAGDDYEKAVFYPEDDDLLVDRDLHVDHYAVAVDELSEARG
jgi:hypothetical protein